MKTGIVLQVFAVLYQYEVADALYGFGTNRYRIKDILAAASPESISITSDKPEEPKRIRIYLEDDEKLLVPKDSKVEYVSPVIDTDDEIYLDKPPIFSSYLSKVLKKPLIGNPQPYYGKAVPAGLYEKPVFTLEDLRVKPEPVANYFGDILAGHAPVPAYPQAAATSQIQNQVKSPVAYGKLLRPILLLPNGWIQGVNIEGNNNVKPVTEERPDDLKYDFRTQTHSLR